MGSELMRVLRVAAILLFLAAAMSAPAIAADEELSDPAEDMDNIYLTSYSADPVRVRVSVGATVLGTFTLPARQLDLTTQDRQIAIPIGTARGRPKFEVLDSAGNIISSREGDVTYTDTPTQRSGTGLNFSVYADAMSIPVGTSAAKASVIKVSGDRAEGNSGTSSSTFRVTLDKPAPANSTVNWAVSSTAADATDFYQVEETGGGGGGGEQTGPQCTNISPPAEAAATGLTKLAFCDDFSTDTVARGSTEASRKIVPGKKWTTQNACFGGSNDGSGTGGGGCNPQPAGDFKFNSDGTLTVKPTFNKHQSFMQTAYLGTDKVISGYYINQKSKGWWVEVKFKADAYRGGDDEQPAIWTMDLCWWFKQWPCSRMGRGDRMLEQDISEYDSGNSYLHQWITNPWSREKTCNGGGKALVLGQWRTVAWHVLPTGESRYYRDGTKGGDCTVGESGVYSDLLLKGTHPILMGSRFDDMTFDYVRVWEAP